MAFNYLIPTISYLAPGYDCTVPMPWEQVGSRLINGSGRVQWYLHVVRAGKRVDDLEGVIEFSNGAPVGKVPEPFRIPAPPAENDAAGYLECGLKTEGGEAIFSSKLVLAFYSIYTAPGRKAFFSDNAYKYASPPTIAQIAEYRQYVDAYPVIRIDRDRDIGMSLILINPYLKAILARVTSFDGRHLKRLRVAPQSVLPVPLEQLLANDERRWKGQIQLTANNRLVTYIAWHSLADAKIISDLEHLDPFRGEATHVPATQQMRLVVGETLMGMRARLTGS